MNPEIGHEVGKLKYNLEFVACKLNPQMHVYCQL
jgi:hypothetical protein